MNSDSFAEVMEERSREQAFIALDIFLYYVVHRASHPADCNMSRVVDGAEGATVYIAWTVAGKQQLDKAFEQMPNSIVTSDD